MTEHPIKTLFKHPFERLMQGGISGHLYDLIKFLVFAIGIIWALSSKLNSYETAEHAEQVFLKKETFNEFKDANEKSHDDIKKMLQEIRDNQLRYKR